EKAASPQNSGLKLRAARGTPPPHLTEATPRGNHDRGRPDHATRTTKKLRPVNPALPPPLPRHVPARWTPTLPRDTPLDGTRVCGSPRRPPRSFGESSASHRARFQ